MDGFFFFFVKGEIGNFFRHYARENWKRPGLGQHRWKRLCVGGLTAQQIGEKSGAR
jgi:hypothetical protein